MTIKQAETRKEPDQNTSSFLVITFFTIVGAILSLGKFTSIGKFEKFNLVDIECSTRGNLNQEQTPDNPKHCFVDARNNTKIGLPSTHGFSAYKEAVIGVFAFPNFTDWNMRRDFFLNYRLLITYTNQEGHSRSVAIEELENIIKLEKKESSEMAEIGRLEFEPGSKVEIQVERMVMSVYEIGNRNYADMLSNRKFTMSLFVSVTSVKQMDIILLARTVGTALLVLLYLHTFWLALRSGAAFSLRFFIGSLGAAGCLACIEPFSIYLGQVHDTNFHLYITSCLNMGLCSLCLIVYLTTVDMDALRRSWVRVFNIWVIVLFIILIVVSLNTYFLFIGYKNSHNKPRINMRHHSVFERILGNSFQAIKTTGKIEFWYIAALAAWKFMKQIYTKSYNGIFSVFIIAFVCLYILNEKMLSINSSKHSHLGTHLLRYTLYPFVHIIICRHAIFER